MSCVRLPLPSFRPTLLMRLAIGHLSTGTLVLERWVSLGLDGLLASLAYTCSQPWCSCFCGWNQSGRCHAGAATFALILVESLRFCVLVLLRQRRSCSRSAHLPRPPRCARSWDHYLCPATKSRSVVPRSRSWFRSASVQQPPCASDNTLANEIRKARGARDGRRSHSDADS